MNSIRFTFLIALIALSSCSHEKNSNPFGNWSTATVESGILSLQNRFVSDKKILEMKYVQNIDFCYLKSTLKYNWMDAVQLKNMKSAQDNGVISENSFLSMNEVLTRNNLSYDPLTTDDFAKLKGNSGFLKIDVTQYFEDIKSQEAQGNFDKNGGIIIEIMRCSDIEKSLKDKNRNDVMHFQYLIHFTI